MRIPVQRPRRLTRPVESRHVQQGNEKLSGGGKEVPTTKERSDLPAKRLSCSPQFLERLLVQLPYIISLSSDATNIVFKADKLFLKTFQNPDQLVAFTVRQTRSPKGISSPLPFAASSADSDFSTRQDSLLDRIARTLLTSPLPAFLVWTPPANPLRLSFRARSTRDGPKTHEADCADRLFGG